MPRVEHNLLFRLEQLNQDLAKLSGETPRHCFQPVHKAREDVGEGEVGRGSKKGKDNLAAV